MKDRFSGIVAFIEAAQANSFAQAAQRLHLTRSAVGKSIAKLEERLGVKLFHRTTRTQKLSDEGQLFYESCMRALAELETGASLLDTSKCVVSGRVRITMPVLFGRYCVTPIMLDLAQRYSELRLEGSFSDRHIHLIDEGFNLAIRSGLIDNHADLVARPIGKQKMILCAAPDYLARNGVPNDLDDLHKHDAIIYGSGGRYIATWKFYIADRVREITIQPRLLLDDLEAIAMATLQGMGIACLPSWLIRTEMQTGRLVPILSTIENVGHDLHLIWPYARQLPYRMRIVIDELLIRLPQAL